MAIDRILSRVALAAAGIAAAAGFDTVFRGSRWVLPVLGAAAIPHVVGALIGRRRASTVPVAASLVVGALFAAWVLVPESTVVGFPTVDAWQQLGRRLGRGWDALRLSDVPFRPGDGALLLAMIAAFTASSVSERLAFARGAAVGALTPGIVLLIWTDAVGAGGGIAVTTVFALASAGFLLARSLETRSRRTVIGGSHRPWRAVALGTLVALVGVAAAAAVAPALPGSDDEPLIDLRRATRGDPSYRTTVAPLVDVSQKLRRGQPLELFEVRASAPDYWRMTALDEYRTVGGGQWVLSATGSEVDTGLASRDVPAGALVQRYAVGPLGERWMPAAYEPVRVSRRDVLVVAASSTLVTPGDTVSGSRYRVVSAVPVRSVTEAQRRATAVRVPDDLQRMTRLPTAVPESISATADRLTAGAATPFDAAHALYDFFRGGRFVYDPTVDLGDGVDAMETFLARRRGFCVQFASTFAVMARAVGIPARVAVGFTSGTRDASGTYHVTTNDAHAWPELWFAGLGWTHMFDPTPPSLLPGGSAQAIEPAPATTQTTAAAAAPVPVAPGPATAAPGGGALVDAGGRGGTAQPLLTLLLVVVALALLVPVVAALAVMARKADRTRRRRSGDPPAAVRGAWDEALDRLLEAGLVAPVADTPRELTTRAADAFGEPVAAPLSSLADRYAIACFAPMPASADDADGAWRDLDELRDALGVTTGRLGRLRRHVDPAPLRPRA